MADESNPPKRKLTKRSRNLTSWEASNVPFDFITNYSLEYCVARLRINAVGYTDSTWINHAHNIVVVEPINTNMFEFSIGLRNSTNGVPGVEISGFIERVGDSSTSIRGTSVASYPLGPIVVLALFMSFAFGPSWALGTLIAILIAAIIWANTSFKATQAAEFVGRVINNTNARQ